MKRSFTVIVGLVALLGSMAFADAKEDSVDRLQNSGDVLKQIMDAPDKGIPEEVLDGAKCIVVVPHLIKAGFIVGGKHGRGVASCRTATGWSAPAFISVGGGSWGLQIGAEGVDLVMLVMNMIFLRQEEVYWVLGRIGVSAGAASAKPSLPRMPESARERVGSTAPTL